MEKDILILAKSLKGTGFCVVGIDVETNKLIRLVSSDNNATNELSNKYMKYNDKSPINILDTIKINFIKPLPIKHQPENWLIDKKYIPKKIKSNKTEDIYKYLSDDNYIYLNTDRTLDEVTINKIDKSIAIFKVNNLRIYKNDYNKLKAYFSYKNFQYKNFTITDPNFNNIKTNKIIGDAIIVVTIPANSYKNLFYKITAQIYSLNSTIN